jgi:type IV pilus assembly protein PilQ
MKGKKSFVTLFTVFLFQFCMFNQALANELHSLDYASVGKGNVQILLTFSESIATPESFTIDNPARIVVDFPSVINNLSKKTEKINIGSTQSVSVVEAGGKTRLVVNLVSKSKYSLTQEANKLTISINDSEKQASEEQINTIQEVDFKRGNNGEGQIILTLKNDNPVMDVFQKQNDVIVDLMNVDLPASLRRSLDVTDFGTPVQTIESDKLQHQTRFTIKSTGKFEHLAYQSDSSIVIEIKPIKEDVLTTNKPSQFGYNGEKLSLNFQNIEVRSILQLLADFTKLNLVTSDTVQGSLTLRLQNVPWDQALDIILKTKGLAMRQNGNVMLIAPAAEISAREKQELEAKKQLEELEPLYSEVFEINFAKATELETILK